MNKARLKRLHIDDSICMTFWKRQNYRGRKQISGCERQGVGGVDYKGTAHGDFWIWGLIELFCIFFYFILFIYFCQHWFFVAAHGLSLAMASGGHSSLRCTGFSLQWPLLLRSTSSRRTGFSSCGTRAQQLWLAGSRAQAQQLWRTGLVAPWHVGSSRTRAQTRVPCIGRQILNHCTTREVLFCILIAVVVTRCMQLSKLRTVH